MGPGQQAVSCLAVGAALDPALGACSSDWTLWLDAADVPSAGSSGSRGDLSLTCVAGGPCDMPCTGAGCT